MACSSAVRASNLTNMASFYASRPLKLSKVLYLAVKVSMLASAMLNQASAACFGDSMASIALLYSAMAAVRSAESMVASYNRSSAYLSGRSFMAYANSSSDFLIKVSATKSSDSALIFSSAASSI